MIATSIGLQQACLEEDLLDPTSAQLERQNAQASAGSFEITPAETPLALFVWSKHRVVPVRLTSLQITEEFFDPSLNPIRAKVSLSLRVLSVDDLGFSPSLDLGPV